jgi:hypothetical protein
MEQGSPFASPETMAGNFDQYMPWHDDLANKSIYHTYVMQSIPVIIALIIVYVAIFAMMFFRYHSSRYVVRRLEGYTAVFWTMFIASLVWAVLSLLCVWYITVGYGMLGGILLGIVFVLLLLLMLAVSVEQEHLTIVTLHKTIHVA